MKKIIFFSVVVILFNACSSSNCSFILLNKKMFTPTAADSVALYFENDKPPKPYEVIGYVQTGAGFGNVENHSSDLQGMKEKAAKQGADALVSIRMTNGREIRFIGLAVKWKP